MAGDGFNNDFWKLRNTSVNDKRLNPKLIGEYNSTRKISNSGLICHAPHVSINFEQTGNANACCYNRTFVLGKFPENSINDIWFGKKADELRSFMNKGDLSQGCQICQKQLESRNFFGVHARHFDDYKANHQNLIQRLFGSSKSAAMPQCMEFELENTCNLECAMCNGYFSSSIRKNREKLPATVSPYNDTFVEQLVPFLPYLKDAKFLGGEPFLIPIYYQIWEKIAEHNPRMLVHITTNGTIYNNRVKDLLERMRCGIIMSIDSIVKETYSKIRVNATYERVMEHIEHFREYTRKKNTWFSYAVCPMTLNWKEMPDLVRHCNERDTYIYFNTVFQPFELSLRSLKAEQMQEIINFYEGQNIETTGSISKLNHKAFMDLINQIEEWKRDKEEFNLRRKRSLTDHENTIENVLRNATVSQKTDGKLRSILSSLIRSDTELLKTDDRDVFRSDPNFMDPDEYQLIHEEVNFVVDLIFENLSEGANTFSEALVLYRKHLNGSKGLDGFDAKVQLIMKWLTHNQESHQKIRQMMTGSASNLIDYIDSAPIVLIKEALRRLEVKEA